MKRIDSKDSVNGKFVEEDLTTNRAGTIINAEFMNNVQEEIVNASTMWGDPLDGTRQDQLKEAILKSSYPGILPVMRYEIIGSTRNSVTVYCILFWLGKVWKDTIDITFDRSQAFYKILSFDLDNEKFNEDYSPDTRLPLLRFGISTNSYLGVHSCIVLFNGNLNPVATGSSNPDNDPVPIEDKHLFAHVPAGGIQEDNTIIESVLFSSEIFKNCILDMRGIPFLYQRKLALNPMRMDNCVVKNLKHPRSFGQYSNYAQFSISGKNNVIHLSDDTKISFCDDNKNSLVDYNTVFIPYDTKDEYYKTLATQSAQRYPIDKEEDYGNNKVFEYFDVYIAGKRYQYPRIVWERKVKGKLVRTMFIDIDMTTVKSPKYLVVTLEAGQNSVYWEPSFSVPYGIGHLIENSHWNLSGSFVNNTSFRLTVTQRLATNQNLVFKSIRVRGIE